MNTSRAHNSFNRNDFNGFPRLADIPENLQNLFYKLRKTNQDITVNFTTKEDKLISLTINYTRTFSLTAIQVFEKLLNNTKVLENYKLLTFNHIDYSATQMTFRTLKNS